MAEVDEANNNPTHDEQEEEPRRKKAKKVKAVDPVAEIFDKMKKIYLDPSGIDLYPVIPRCLGDLSKNDIKIILDQVQPNLVDNTDSYELTRAIRKAMFANSKDPQPVLYTSFELKAGIVALLSDSTLTQASVASKYGVPKMTQKRKMKELIDHLTLPDNGNYDLTNQKSLEVLCRQTAGSL